MSRRDRSPRRGPTPVVVALVVLLLAACGSDDGQPATGAQPAPTSTTTTAAPSPTAPSTTRDSTTTEDTAAPGSTTEAPNESTTTETPPPEDTPSTSEAAPTTAPPTTAPPTTAPPASSAERPVAPTRPDPSAEPTGVAIPAIDASSDLLHLGLRPDGTAEVPEDFDLASWYDLGGRPGGTGMPTVILGHVDSTSGPAIFFRLRDLSRGDEVQVAMSDGSTASYAVTGTEEYPKDQFPTAAVFGATPDDVVRLVTCSGEFDRGDRSYTDNLVVSAERIA